MVSFEALKPSITVFQVVITIMGVAGALSKNIHALNNLFETSVN